MIDDLEHLNSQIGDLNAGRLTEDQFIQELRVQLGYTREELRVVIRNVRCARLAPIKTEGTA